MTNVILEPNLASDDKSLRERLDRLEKSLRGELHVVGNTSDPVAPPFTNNWRNFDTAPGNPRMAAFYRMGGRVFLEGIVSSGTFQAPMFTLPDGYRPFPPSTSEYTRAFAVTSNNGLCSIVVYGDGRVLPVNGDPSWVSLDGISFRHA
jgi:hypothetical protein